MSGATEPVGIKCVVWDLDDTLWDGVLLEGDVPRARTEVVDTLRTLDGRGILHAVASRGDHDRAVAHLRELGLLDYFVHVEVGWDAKSVAVSRTAAALNLNPDSFAFVDNDPSERDEVADALPMVRCYPDSAAADLPDRPEFVPERLTGESRRRRVMYQAEQRRRVDEERAGAHRAEFLAGLDLVMTVRRAREEDLERARELTVRTHQLNTTGRTYSMEQLRALCADPRHEVLVASLTDRYGSYGTIGLAVSELAGDDHVLTLLLMSCRVVSRGAGSALLHHVVARARGAGRRPCAEFVPSSVNRIMLVNLRFAGFAPAGERDGVLLLAVDPAATPAPAPTHVRIVDGDDPARRPAADPTPPAARR
ncbi:HAD-IIIC family phosphatase [Micromonospora echinospora]|uniref:HAD-IIIC family phosphatase n=1 Tax=Micromonospora echinospora TaxID=1877 RepID=UPI0033DFCAF0